jgi:acyl-CoA dehydrogenase
VALSSKRVIVRRLTGMDFNLSAKTTEYATKLQAFMDAEVFPAESVYEHQRAQLAAAGKPHGVPAVVEELKVKARALGLWNLFLPHSQGSASRVISVY